MKRFRIPLFLLLGLVLMGGILYIAQGPGTPASLLEKAFNMAQKSGITSFDGSKIQKNATNTNALEEVAGLAIKDINLFQGNKGVELWRLNASWAHLSQTGDTIDVDSPTIRYALGEGSVSNPSDDTLNVTAHNGRVSDNQRFLTLWGDVTITRFDDTLTGPRMNYDAPTRVMIFPEGAALDSPAASGTANVFTWDLAKNELYGTNGVLVVLKPRPEPALKTPASASGISAGSAVIPVTGVQNSKTSSKKVTGTTQKTSTKKTAITTKKTPPKTSRETDQKTSVKAPTTPTKKAPQKTSTKTTPPASPSTPNRSGN